MFYFTTHMANNTTLELWWLIEGTATLSTSIRRQLHHPQIEKKKRPKESAGGSSSEGSMQRISFSSSLRHVVPASVMN
jgi:hypothetical protein